MKVILIQLLVFILIIIATSYIFNHVNAWLAYLLPIIYIFLFKKINNKIYETFS